MKIYKIIAYLYLAFAIIFSYDVYQKIATGESFWISLLFVALALFMFFFRLKNAKKFNSNDTTKK